MPPPELPRAHLLHDLEHGWHGNGGRRLLYDFLMPPLDGTVAPEQGHGVPILVSEELDLQVMGVLGQLHEEDWGAGDLALHLGGTAGWLAPPRGSRAGAGSSPKGAQNDGRDARGFADLSVLPPSKTLHSRGF